MHTDKLRPHQQLRIPTPDQRALSLCEASPKGLAEWLGNLPKANLGESARLLYQCLVELNQLETSSSSRMRLMELLRPEVLFVCKQLERHFLNQSVVLDERPRKVANLCQALQSHLANGYKLIVVQDASSFRKEHAQQLATALQRSLHSLFGPLVRACQLYCAVADSVWLEIHLLYQTASSLNLQQLQVSDPLSPPGTLQTVENAYLSALLVGCARTSQMRQNAIANLAEVIPAWAPLARLVAADKPGALFWVPTTRDAPPRPKSRFSDTEKQALLGIDPAPLVDAISRYQEAAEDSPAQACLPGAKRLPAEQLEHLRTAWGDSTERTSQRFPAQGKVSLCIGMTSVHYFMSGEQAFGDVLKSPASAAFGRRKKSDDGTDVWARSFDAQAISTSMRGEAMEEIQYKAPAGQQGSFAGTSESEKYPLYSLSLVSQSPEGYCLSWSHAVPGQLQAGELLGIQDPSRKNWSLAVVRWIRQVRTGGTQMGVELMAPNTQPCGLQLIRKGEQNSQFLRALLIPESAALGRAASLITPRIPFREGSKVLINLDGMEKRALLGNRQATTGSFSQFEYREDALRDPLADPAQGARKGRPGEEDFDSLWKSL
ncbi:molecular chaperone [Pseudomonas sp. N040]|uniref:molecular chaperone n=1 Tax=Pseudomonas sp. N040 TaxID=2785325 RepID=UPI0018A31155|nr:molecular chaperone [Pseudomonas sp. N040]MBF7730981.1 molecular chaperone [Pseudomonas sp. N040]MBW7014624.1 molecular chaperone [Pseudomonas sp. N040]